MKHCLKLTSIFAEGLLGIVYKIRLKMPEWLPLMVNKQRSF